MENIGMVGVGSITIICYVIAMAVKATTLDNKWLPVICAVMGGLLGATGLYVLPDFPAEDILTAISVGVSSGLAATGANQVYKQLTKDDKTED